MSELPLFRFIALGEAEGKTTIEELNTPSRGLWIFRKGMESEKAGENGYPVEPGGEGYLLLNSRLLRCRILIMKESLMMQDTTCTIFTVHVERLYTIAAESGMEKLQL